MGKQRIIPLKVKALAIGAGILWAASNRDIATDPPTPERTLATINCSAEGGSALYQERESSSSLAHKMRI